MNSAERAVDGVSLKAQHQGDPDRQGRGDRRDVDLDLDRSGGQQPEIGRMHVALQVQEAAQGLGRPVASRRPHRQDQAQGDGQADDHHAQKAGRTD
jgi:hypothetical protein